MAERNVKKIPLGVSGGKGLNYRSWPVTQGIPFEEGDLERGAPVRVVDHEGNPYPTQSSCLAAWDKDLKHVRWLLLDFQADFRDEDEGAYFLEYGEGIESPKHPSSIRVDQVGDHLQVDTGPMRIQVRNRFEAWKKPKADLFGSCLLKSGDEWHDLFGRNPGPFLYMKDHRGFLYDSFTSAPFHTVSIEESGPIRTSICIKGFHAMRNGPRFCPYILRIHLFAGKTDLRIQHTFVFDQEPHQIELSAIGMRFPLALGDDLEASVAGIPSRPRVGGWEGLRLLQRDDKHYDVDLDGKKHAEGERSSGWASLNGSRGSVVAVVKDFWKEYPKGLGLDRDGMDLEIWPEAHQENLRFTTPFEEPAIYFKGTRDEEEFKRLLAEKPTAPLNLKSVDVQTEEDVLWIEEMMEKHGKGRTASHCDTGTSNGVGAAKTTEFYIRLDTEQTNDSDTEALASIVQEPLIAPADPAYACATDAFGPFYHAGDPRFRQVDEGLDYLIDSVAIEPIERCRLYGMMRYGNMVCSHSTGPNTSYVLFKDTDPEKALRYVGPYNNEANDQIMAVWGNFLRTGRRDHLFLAQAYSRNVADVGTIHAHPTRRGSVGLNHYHTAHQWSGTPSPSHTLVAGTLIDYCVTGNRRMLEVAEEVADWAVRNQEDCGIISCRNGRLHREFTGPLWCLLEVYRVTWKESYGDLARRSMNWFLRTLKNGRYPTSVYTRGVRGDEADIEPIDHLHHHARNISHILSYAHRLFNSKALRDHIIAEANYLLWDSFTDNFVTAEMARKMLTVRSLLWKVDEEFYWTQWKASHGLDDLPILCLAYQITGDLKYAAMCKDHLEGYFKRLVERCRNYMDWRFTWLTFGSYVPRLTKAVADALNNDPKALARAEKEWKEKRARLGRPVYTGPGVDLTQDKMNSAAVIANRPPEDLPREAPLRSYEPITSLGKLSTEDHAEN